MYTVSFKVPGGKLIRVKTDVVEGILVNPLLSGDFFLMPSESVSILERVIDGWPLSDLQGLEEALARAIDENRIVVAGISPRAIIVALSQLLNPDVASGHEVLR